MNKTDYSWAAGLFVAEGHARNDTGRAEMQLGMMDHDAVKEFARVLEPATPLRRTRGRGWVDDLRVGANSNGMHIVHVGCRVAETLLPELHRYMGFNNKSEQVQLTLEKAGVELSPQAEPDWLAWTAGLMVGDGCVSQRGQAPRVGISMRDRRAIEKAREVWLEYVDRVSLLHTSNRWGVAWYIQLEGRPAERVLSGLLPKMRRNQTSAKAASVLSTFASYKRSKLAT